MVLALQGANIMIDMTKEIAYNLGGFLYPNFYGNMYKNTNKDCEGYDNFFDFSDNSSEYGILKREEFKTLEQKVWYVKGAVTRFNVEITDVSIKLSYANAHYYRELLNSFVKELYIKFFGDKNFTCVNSEECERGIILEDSLFTVPCIHTWRINADKDFISYLLDMEEYTDWYKQMEANKNNYL